MNAQHLLPRFLVLSLLLHSFGLWISFPNTHFKPKKKPLMAHLQISPPAQAVQEVPWVLPEVAPFAAEQPKPQPEVVPKFTSKAPSPAQNGAKSQSKTWQEVVKDKIRAQHQAGLFYPPEAIAQNLEGEVEVLIFLDKNGTVLAARVETSSGFALLDNAAVRVARALKSLPHDAPEEIVLPIVFRLE